MSVPDIPAPHILAKILALICIFCDHIISLTATMEFYRINITHDAQTKNPKQMVCPAAFHFFLQEHFYSFIFRL